MGEKPTNLKSGISSGTFGIREFFKNLLGERNGQPAAAAKARDRGRIFAIHFHWKNQSLITRFG